MEETNRNFTEDSGYTLIAYDEDSRAAIVFRGLDTYEPYVACFEYDIQDGDWRQGYYCSDLGSAMKEYDRMRGIEEPFCEVRWYREDIATYLENYTMGVPVTEANIDACISQLGKSLQDSCIQDGWETMSWIINDQILPDQKREQKTKVMHI